jgi:hypothetical protein
MSFPENLPNASPVETGAEDFVTPVDAGDVEQELLDDTPESVESDPVDQELTEQQKEYIDHRLGELLGEYSQELEKAAMMVLNAQSENLSNMQYWQSEVAPKLGLSQEDVNGLIEFVKLVIKEREEAKQEADEALESKEAGQEDEPLPVVATESAEPTVVETTPDEVSEPPTQP